MADTKQRNQRIVFAVLAVVAALVWYFGFARTAADNGKSTTASNYQPINAQDYGVVFSQLGKTQKTEYKATSRNIFTMTAVPVATTDTPQRVKTPWIDVGPIQEPEIPAKLEMKFFGYGSLPANGPRLAFLMDGEQVRIVAEGEMVLNHIRITHIGNDRIEFLDTLTGRHGDNKLEENPAA